jgi:hypothetical protein
VARRRDIARLCADSPAIAGALESPCQDEHGAERLNRLIDRPPRLEAVLPGGEYGAVAAAALAQAWLVPGAGLRAARILRHKAELHRVAAASGIPRPRWSLVDGPSAIAKFRAVSPECVLVPPTCRTAKAP